MIIKKVSTKSLDARQLLRKMQRELLQGSPIADPSLGHWWLVFDGEDPVGFASMVPSFRWDKTGYLNRAGILTPYRGKGLQKRLIKVREAYARRIGYEHLISDTRFNPPSANSLIACGFKTYTPKYPWGFTTSIYWRKHLKETK